MHGLEKETVGSTIIESFVLGLIVLIIGFLFLVVYRVNHAKTLSSNLAATTTSPSPLAKDTPPQGKPPVSVPSTSPSTSTQTANQNVIAITPLGITMTVPDSIKDLTYHSSTAADGTITVTFSTSTITNEAPSCSSSSGQGAFDSLVRGSGNYPTSSNPSDGGLIKQEANYYIAYQLPTGPCAKSLSPDIQNTLDQQAQDFYSSLSSIQVTT